MKQNGRDGKDVGKLEKAGEGVLLEITDILLVVGEGAKVVFERVELKRLETPAGKLLGLYPGRDLV